MDWKTLLSKNFVAVVALLSTFVGAIIGVAPTIFLQYKQRRWLLDDQKRQWKRERLKAHADHIRIWIDTCLQLIYTLGAYGGFPIEWDKITGEQWQKFQDQITAYNSNTSIVFTDVSALHDKISKDLFYDLQKTYTSASQIKKEGKFDFDLKKWVTDIYNQAAKLDNRIEALLEETFNPN